MSSTFMHRHSGRAIKLAGKLAHCVVTQYDIARPFTRKQQDVLFTQPGYKDTFSINAEDFKAFFCKLNPIPGDVWLRDGQLYEVRSVDAAEGKCSLLSKDNQSAMTCDIQTLTDQFELITQGTELLLLDGTFKIVAAPRVEQQHIHVEGGQNIPLSLISAVTMYPEDRVKLQEAYYAKALPEQEEPKYLLRRGGSNRRD